MRDNIFFDTNIILYSYSVDEPQKREIANKLIFSQNEILISTQIINETVNILYKKFKIDTKNIIKVIEELEDIFKIVNFSINTQKYALYIKNKYNFQYYDSLVLSTALENRCNIIFSEDFQHNQIIENRLKIINPFKGNNI